MHALRIPHDLGVAQGVRGVDRIGELPQGAPAGARAGGNLPRPSALRGLRGDLVGWANDFSVVYPKTISSFAHPTDLITSVRYARHLVACDAAVSREPAAVHIERIARRQDD